MRAGLRARFIGRDRELAALDAAAASGKAVAMLYGVAGVGKTTILRQFAARCAEAGRYAVTIDGREVGGTPDGMMAAFAALSPDPPVQSAGVLLIDNYETLEPLDRWMRDTFLPSLPADHFVVIAGRRPPSAAWRTDPAWSELFLAMRVENLEAPEAAAYLRARAVPEDAISEALEFTGGHPLALSLVAELHAAPGRAGRRVTAETDVIQSLVERFAEAVPDDKHRQTLELCALARSTTEGLVAWAVPGEDAHARFRWLQDLSFVEAGPAGLVPHELARNALVADLKWRNPARGRELRAGARAFYRDALTRLTGPVRQAILFDYIYLHRENPAIASAFQFDAERTGYLDVMRPDDRPAILEMVRRHEGEASARLADGWLTAQPANVQVIRANDGEGDRPRGFLLTLALEEIQPGEGPEDPAVARVIADINHRAPLRKGERGAFFRFWMDDEAYQSVSSGQSLIFVQMVLHSLVTPHLALSYIPCREPDFWSGMFSYAGYTRVLEAETPPYGLFAHDWRRRPPLVWLEVLAKREETAEIPTGEPAGAELRIFDREEFGREVQRALRDCLSAEKLKAGPLLRSRMVADRRAPGAVDGVRALQELLKEAAMTMRSEARDQKLFRVLRTCYFEPCPSQEAAAEKLQIGIATLRRHLKEATQRVVDYLWTKETG